MVLGLTRIDSRVSLRENENLSDKKQTCGNTAAQSYGSKVLASLETMTARLPIIAKPHKSGGAKPGIRKLTDE